MGATLVYSLFVFFFGKQSVSVQQLDMLGQVKKTMLREKWVQQKANSLQSHYWGALKVGDWWSGILELVDLEASLA